MAKLRGLLDAIDGAFAVSKAGPPTIRFIWGTLEHFFDHVEHGRRDRILREHSVRREAAEKSARTSTAEVAGTLQLEQMATDLERVFGAAWRAHDPR